MSEPYTLNERRCAAEILRTDRKLSSDFRTSTADLILADHETTAERDRLLVVNAELVKAAERIYERWLSLANNHSVPSNYDDALVEFASALAKAKELS